MFGSDPYTQIGTSGLLPPLTAVFQLKGAATGDVRVRRLAPTPLPGTGYAGVSGSERLSWPASGMNSGDVFVLESRTVIYQVCVKGVLSLLVYPSHVVSHLL
jgi:hypothetical protein